MNISFTSGKGVDITKQLSTAYAWEKSCYYTFVKVGSIF